jgi:hypothetical protein
VSTTPNSVFQTAISFGSNPSFESLGHGQSQVELPAAQDHSPQHLVDGEGPLPRPAGDLPSQGGAALPQEGRRELAGAAGAEEALELVVVDRAVLLSVVGLLALVVFAQGHLQGADRVDAISRAHDGRQVPDLRHHLVDVLELPQRGPARVLASPASGSRQPHGEGLGEVLYRMALGVVVVEVMDEASAARARNVGRAVGSRCRTEALTPALAPVEPVGVVEGVTRLVAQELHAGRASTALHFEHLATLECDEPGVRQVEGNGESRDAVGREPVRGEPDVGPEADPRALEAAREPVQTRLDRRAFDPQTEAGDAPIEEGFVGQLGPGGLATPAPRGHGATSSRKRPMRRR